MLMVYAMIYGAHLLPYGWLYQSKTYYILSVVVPFAALYIGCNYPPFVIAAVMILTQMICCAGIILENRWFHKAGADCL